MVKHIQELAKHSFYDTINLHFKQRNMDELLINYRKGVW